MKAWHFVLSLRPVFSLLLAGLCAPAALAQPPQVVGEPAAFPADQGSKIGDLQLVFRRTAQRVEYVIVGQRKIAITLQLAVDLVVHPQLDPHEGNPRAEL